MDPHQKDENVVGVKVKSSPGERSPSTSNSFEMELGSGGHHQVKLEPDGGRGAGAMEGPVKSEMEDKTVLELEGLLKDLHVKGDPQGKVMNKGELLSKLEKARVETADREKAARRKTWLGETRMELLKRAVFKREMASVTPPEKVTDWKGNKPDISKMSVAWREALKEKRTSFLFDEVIQILMENAAGEAKGQPVLACRTVSHAWKGSADSAILSKLDRGNNYWGDTLGSQMADFDYLPVCVPLIPDKLSMIAFNFWTSERFYTGDNLFFSRRLCITGGDVEWEDNLDFWKGLEALLRRWGFEIWVFWIKFDKGMTSEVMYKQLLKCLKLMPNLRCLHVYDHPRNGSSNSELVKDIYGPLKSRIAGNPLPELPHLRHLQFQECVPTPLVQAAVAKYSGTLEYLLIQEVVEDGGEDPRKLLTNGDLTLPRLKFLHFSTLAFSRPSLSPFDFNMKCPKLEMLFLIHPDLEEAADVLRLFQNLNRLKSISTLRRLSLTVQPAARIPMLMLSDEQLKSLFLDLPQLESLTLSVIQINLENIDFLLPCVALKELTLSYDMSNITMDEKASTRKGKQSKDDVAPLPPDEIIQFSEYTNRLYESNMWRLLPKLKHVKIGVIDSCPTEEGKEEIIKVKMYTREGWGKHLGGNQEGSCCANSIDIDMGSGHQVKLEEPEPGVKDWEGQAEGDTDKSVLEVDELVQNLHVMGQGDPHGKAMKGELLSKLELARMEAACRVKAARRNVWKEEVKVRVEYLRREELKRNVRFRPLMKVPNRPDEKTKADMSRISINAREEFKSDKTNFLFREVFPILFENTPPLSRTAVVVTCRPVSKAWKQSVEACILPTFEQSYDSQGQLQSGIKGSQDTQVCGLDFHRSTMVRFNLREQLYSRRNPFFARRLCIIGGDVDWKNNPGFWKAAEVLLRRRGSEIWIIYIKFDKGMSYEVMYELLVKYLTLMPNLRSIGIVHSQREETLGEDVWKAAYDSLRARISRNPLPELPFLKSVWFQGHVVAPLAQAIFAKYWRTLEFAGMHESENQEVEDPMELLTGRDLELPRLTELNVTSFASRQGALDISRSCPSLATFQLIPCHMKGPEDVAIFFQNLNRLRPIPTLKRLCITIQPSNWTQILKLSDEQLRSLFLDLPQLEMFSLTVIQVNLKSIDFLLPCAFLKDLELTHQKVSVQAKRKSKSRNAAAPPPLPEDEMIQFSQYMNRLYESPNLWKLFPELGLVSIRDITSELKWKEEEGLGHMGMDKVKATTYSREGYKKFLEGRLQQKKP